MSKPINPKASTGDKDMPTRQGFDGTRIVLRFGSAEVPATLNDSTTAKAFVATLPRSIRMGNYGTDHCGLIEDLPYDSADVHRGWLNGDVNYATDGPWFVVFFGGEERSDGNDFQVNIGRIDCALSTVANLAGSHEVMVELA